MNRQRIIAVSRESDQDLTAETTANMEVKSHRPWSNLPGDVVSYIMQLLNIADQIRLSCVCKNFRRQPIQHDRPVDRLPWLVTCHDSESDGFLCKLFDPSQKKPQEVYQITGPKIGGWFRPNYAISKDGWLFFLKEKDRYVDELFLFCPYTKEIISLPDLHHGFWEYKIHNFPAGERMRILTFSSANPKSEECVFFVAYYLYNNETQGKITMCSYQPNKDKQWRTKTTFYGMKYVKITNLLYDEGNLYIMNKEGFLGIYDVSTERWSFRYYWLNTDATFDHHCCSLVSHKGFILLAVMDRFANWELYRLEDSSTNYKEWIHQSELENQALFMAHQPWECTILVDQVSGDLEHAGNKIFYHQIQGASSFVRFRPRRRLEISNLWKFYDLTASEYFVCEGTEFEYFVPREEGKKSLIRPNKNHLALWIEPPKHALNRFLH